MTRDDFAVVLGRLHKMSEVLFQSFDGQRLNLLDLQPGAFTLETIAHALALKNRFTGHTIAPYSVAQHCVEGSWRIAGPFKLAFLLHELDEVFLPDIHGPLKPLVAISLGDYYEQWRNIGLTQILRALSDLKLESLRPLLTSPEVKAMDWQMLHLEKTHYMKPVDWEWNFPEGFQPYRGDRLMDVQPWPWQQAEQYFIRAYNTLVAA
jgi:hypothetical protein